MIDIDEITDRAWKITKAYREKYKGNENPLAQISHIHSEVSEIHRVVRNKDSEYDATFSPRWRQALANEIADVLILTLDFASPSHGLTIAEVETAIERKLKIKEKELSI